MPLVSIVMPTLNQADFIADSLNSVLRQDHAELELIVADGGSTDGTLDILREKAARDPRLRWFSEPDTGPAQALNRALTRARGTIIGWLNSDDLYVPGAISRAVEALRAHPDWIMVYGKARHVDAAGRPLRMYPTVPPDRISARMADGCFICQPTVFFKAVMWRLLGPLDESLKAAFDYDYWMRAFKAFPDRIGFIDRMQAKSRLHERCITTRMRRRVALEGVEVVSRHLGRAPVHWISTYVEELLAMPEEERGIDDLRAHLLQLLRDVGGKIAHADMVALRERILTDPLFDDTGEIGRLERAYDRHARHAVEAIRRATMRDRATRCEEGGELVGLLTFPNSGTSWFLNLARAATGISNHTAYEEESLRTGGWPSRGAYLLNTRNSRPPERGEPSLVKSHVAFYGEEDVSTISPRRLAREYEQWKRHLPPGCGCHVRLVRNPFDNIRARYHLYLKKAARAESSAIMPFHEYARADIVRYMRWHAFCNRLATEAPVLTLDYADLLDERSRMRGLRAALEFAGFSVSDEDLRRAFERFPAIYRRNGEFPVHLRYYREEDILFMARRMKEWLPVLESVHS